MMPDNVSPGALEDFLGAMVPAEDPCWAYAGEAQRFVGWFRRLFVDP